MYVTKSHTIYWIPGSIIAGKVQIGILPCPYIVPFHKPSVLDFTNLKH